MNKKEFEFVILSFSNIEFKHFSKFLFITIPNKKTLLQSYTIDPYVLMYCACGAHTVFAPYNCKIL